MYIWSVSIVQWTSLKISHGLKMYFTPHAARPNLTVFCSAQVCKLELTKGDSVTATAVEFVHEGKTYKASVKKEVVLSAG